jgi:hypothetical protein
MRKRLVFKLAVMVAALGAVTLLQGCDSDENGVVIGGAWMPVGMVPLPALVVGTGTGAGGGGAVGGGGQTATGATAGAVAAGAGGGGGQVSVGGVVQ